MKRLFITALLVVSAALPALAAERPAIGREREKGRERALPASLEGSEMDGALTLDSRGRFVPNEEAIRLFDYYLTATGEEDAATINARITAQIERRLSGQARKEALTLFSDYLRYREAARNLKPVNTSDPQSLETGFAQLQDLRRDVFGRQRAEQLFGKEELEARQVMEARRVTGLKKAAGENISLKAAAASPRVPETLAPLHLAAEESALVEKGASAAEIRELRVRVAGIDAANRLEALDRENAAWSARMASYREARNGIEAGTILSATEKNSAIEQLLAERFSEQERLRVRALDRINGLDE